MVTERGDFFVMLGAAVWGYLGRHQSALIFANDCEGGGAVTMCAEALFVLVLSATLAVIEENASVHQRFLLQLWCCVTDRSWPSIAQ